MDAETLLRVLESDIRAIQEMRGTESHALARALWQRGWTQTVLVAGPPDKTCPTCGQWIERQAGDPRPNSPGDHDPAYHVAKAYGTTHPTVAD